MSDSDRYVQLCKAILVRPFCSKLTRDIRSKGVKCVRWDIRVSVCQYKRRLDS